MRVAKRKLRKKQLLNIFEMGLFCYGWPWLPQDIDISEVSKKWPEFREIILSWWNGEDDRPPFCSDFTDFPAVKRKGKLPYFEVYGKPKFEEKIK